MSKLLEYPNQSLREPSVEVNELSDHVFRIIQDMQVALSKFPTAVGIAAPQVGHNERIIAIQTPQTTRLMINPVIVERSGVMSKSDEGCLSVPKVKGAVQRDWSITVKYQTTEDWVPKQEIFVGFDAFVIQHEIDHLEGVLFTDHLTGGDKKRADKKLAKRKGK